MLDKLIDDVALEGPQVLDDKIVDMKKEKEVTFDEMVNAIKKSDVVYFGEQHNVEQILSAQLKVLDALHRNNSNVSVGLEMFNFDQQHLIDGYLSGKMSLEELIREYGKGKESFNMNHYGKILDYARDKGLEVRGLIIPRQLAAMVTRIGLEVIDGQNLMIKSTDVDLSSEPYARFVKEAISESVPMMGTGMNPDVFVRAQAVKDEVMGKNVAEYFAEHTKKNPQMLAIMGAGHCNYRFGVPDRAKKWARNEGKKITDSVIVSTRLDESADKNKLLNLVKDKKLADFVWFKWA